MRPVTVYPRGEGAIASARGLVKVYGSGETAVRALDGVDVDFAAAELTAIMGPSGSGKSTLMHCMAGLDTITDGTVVVDGEDLARMGQRGLTRLRRNKLGFVFQAFNLIPTLTAEENITLPLDIARRPVDRDWFDTVVDAVGLRDRLGHRPHDPTAASFAHRVLFLADGRLVGEIVDPTTEAVLDALRELGVGRREPTPASREGALVDGLVGGLR